MASLFASLRATDVLAFAINLACFLGYRAWQKRRERAHVRATLQSQQAALRAEWVADVLRTGNGILGVQTLRNAIMGSVFFASNTMVLVLGTLTLTAQGRLRETFGALDLVPAASSQVVLVKLLLLLLTLLFGFFCFTSAIRLFAHASVSIAAKGVAPERVCAQIDTGWDCQRTGIRSYYYAASVLFWLFGALWFVLATLGVIVLMHRYDSLLSEPPDRRS